MRVSLFFSTAALALSAGMAVADTTLHVLHINDFHSRIEPINAFNSTCSASDDAEGKCFGGTARLFTLINDMRDSLSAEGDPVLVLDAGDSSQGSLFYTTYGGQAEADFIELIGFDAMAVGNHEFDLGPEGLAVFLDTVSFPILSSNLDVSASNILAGRVMPYTIIERGGLNIGIVSALATDTPETASPGPTVVFEDDITALRRVVAELQEQGVAPIIALTHVGLNRDREIAAQVPGLAAVVGGHSHTYMSASDPDRDAPYPTWVDADDGALVPVVQAYSYGKYVGHLILELDDAGQLVHASGDTIVVDGSITPDAEVAAQIADLAGPIEELKAQVVAESAGYIEGDRTVCRAQECEMGNLVADAMLARVADQGITIAIQNGGGLRASISEGQVTMGDILSVLPFQNTLSTFQVTGAVVIDALENGASRLEDGAGRFAQVAGLKYTLTAANEPGNRISDVMVMQDGDWTAIEPDTLYGLVSNDYVRQGGDGFSMFSTEAVNAYDFGPDLADVLAEYMIENAPYQPYLDGRITVN